ncbi:hypothetical protein [Bradyrhizobium sp. AZCC 2230]|uniref:hypothetical protein n=1 Tax=Bradyrhizobium sp. AZCC 2230 TaxID=3117021 RepID=UPI002FF36890
MSIDCLRRHGFDDFDDADAGLPSAAGRFNARKACRKKIKIHLLAAHQPFEFGDAGFGEREGGALVVVRR